jgi:hypothetical protein
MSSELGEAKVPIRATLDKLDADLKQARGKIDGALKGIGDNLQNIGKIALGGILVAIAAIGTGVVMAAKQAIPAASDLNEALNASSVVFGDAAGKIHDYGKQASETAGLSAREFNQMGAEMGAVLKNFGHDVHSAADNTIDLGQRAADMASIFNTDVGDAMSAIQSGLIGSSEPLRRFGVDISDAAVKSKALEMGLGDITRQTDSYAYSQATIALIMEQTNDIAGDFVNTSDQLANAGRVQQARWENFMASMGGLVLPIVEKFQLIFMDIAERVFPIVLGAMEPIIEVAGRVADAVGSFIDAIMGGQDPLDAVLQLVYDLGTAFGLSEEKAAEIRDRIADVIAKAQEIIEPIATAIANFVSWKDVLIGLGIAIAAVVLPALWGVIAAAAPIIATAVAIIAVVALLRNAWENDWGGIRTFIVNLWDNKLKPLFDTLREWLAVNIPVAIDTLKSFWENTLLPAIQNVWSWIQNTLFPLFQRLWDWLGDTIPAVLETLGNFWTNTLLPAIEAVWDFISNSRDSSVCGYLGALRGSWRNSNHCPAGLMGECVIARIDNGLGVHQR